MSDFCSQLKNRIARAWVALRNAGEASDRYMFALPLYRRVIIMCTATLALLVSTIGVLDHWMDHSTSLVGWILPACIAVLFAGLNTLVIDQQHRARR